MRAHGLKENRENDVSRPAIKPDLRMDLVCSFFMLWTIKAALPHEDWHRATERPIHLYRVCTHGGS